MCNVHIVYLKRTFHIMTLGYSFINLDFCWIYENVVIPKHETSFVCTRVTSCVWQLNIVLSHYTELNCQLYNVVQNRYVLLLSFWQCCQFTQKYARIQMLNFRKCPRYLWITVYSDNYAGLFSHKNTWKHI